MKLRKLMALLLALTLSVFAFVSCGDPDDDDIDPVELVENAEAALANQPYYVDTTMSFECENEQIQAMFQNMGGTMTMAVDGKKVQMQMAMDMSYYTVSIDAVIVDNVLYMNQTMSATGGVSQSQKTKIAMTDEQYNEMLGTMGGSSSIEVKPSDFESVTYKVEDGAYVVTCTNLSADKYETLNGALGALPQGTTVAVSDASYVLTVKGGKLEAAVLDATYAITTSGVTVDLDMSIELDYDFTKTVDIKVPADAEAYTERNYEDMYG